MRLRTGIISLFIFGFIASYAFSQETSLTSAGQDLPPGAFITEWHILGPVPLFDATTADPGEEAQKKVFDENYLDPGIVDLTQQVKIKDRDYAWQKVQAVDGIVHLDKTFPDKVNHTVYAFAEIAANDEQKALLGIGSDDAAQVWLNGEAVLKRWASRALSPDDDIVAVTFKKGTNRLLLKIQNGIGEWSFCCRPVDKEQAAEKFVSLAGTNRIDDMKTLLEGSSIDVNSKNKQGVTAFQRAQIKGRKEIADWLVQSGADANLPYPSKEKMVDALFESEDPGKSIGTAVLIAQERNILYEKAFGYADIGNREQATSKTKFRIGSVTKQFTASAILKMEEEGLLSVDDPLSKYLPDFPRGNEVKIHHLLTHTSGIQSYTSKPEFVARVANPIKPDDLIAFFKGDPYTFDPGEKMDYNNSGFFLLSYLVEKLTQKSYEEYLQEKFFQPLQMADSGIHDATEILENEAYGYAYVDGHLQKAKPWDMSWAGGAGAIYSTVQDLYRWNEGIFNGKVLSELSLKKAFTPAKLNNGNTADQLGSPYAYGWLIAEFRSLQEISHSGGLDGFLSNLARYPKQNLTVAIMVNCSPPTPNRVPSSLSREIAEIYLWDQMSTFESPKVDQSVNAITFDDYVGRYEFPASLVMTITKDDERLFAQLTSQGRNEIFPKGNDEFFWKVVDAQIKFVRDEQKRVVNAVHSQNGQTFSAPRMAEIEVVEIDPATLETYIGKYEIAPGFTLEITKDKNQLDAQATGQPKLHIYPRSETEFFYKDVKAEITFEKNEQGKVTGMVLEQAGAKHKVKRLEQ